MIKRRKQKITSPYGPRGNIFHKGVDLRCYNFLNWKKQPVVFPCDCYVLKVGYQEKWGYNVIARPVNGGDIVELKFIHLADPRDNVNVKTMYEKGELIGYTMLTEYMKKTGYYEHLHFETWNLEGHEDPTIFFDEMEIKYA